MNQRNFYRLAVKLQRSLQPALVSGSLSKTKPALAPQDASNFLNEMLLGRPCGACSVTRAPHNCPVFVGTLQGTPCSATAHHGAAR